MTGLCTDLELRSVFTGQMDAAILMPQVTNLNSTGELVAKSGDGIFRLSESLSCCLVTF